MGLVIVILYIFLACAAPWEKNPDLLKYHIMAWVSVCGILGTGFRLISSRVTLKMPQFLLMPLFVALAMFSLVLQGWVGGAMVVLTKLLPVLILYLMVSVNVSSSGAIRAYSSAMVVTALYVLVRCILAFYVGIDAKLYTLNEAELNFSMVRIRGLDFLSDPNDFGQFLLACIPLAAINWKLRHTFRNIFLVVVPILLLLLGIYLSGSRGTLLGLLVLAYLSFRRLSKIVAPFFATGLGFGALALGFGSGRSVSLSGGTGGQRLMIWSDLIQTVKQHPFKGIGFDHVYDVTVLTAHNSYLLCLTEIGLFGYICWIALLFTHGVQLREVLRRADLAPETRRIASLLFASYATLLVTSFTLSRTYALTIYMFLAQITGFVIMVQGKRIAPPLRTFSGRWLLASTGAGVAIVIAIYVMVRLHWTL